MEESKIRETIEHFGITTRSGNGEELILITRNVDEAKRRQIELRNAKPEILAYIHAREEEEKRKRDEIEKQFENGTLPIEVREITHFSSALDTVVTENEIAGDTASLSRLMGVQYNGYYTDLPPGKYPISVLPAWQKMHAKKLDLEAKFREARETGKKIMVSKQTEECKGEEEECSVDIVYTFAMPDGTVKIERIHTY